MALPNVGPSKSELPGLIDVNVHRARKAITMQTNRQTGEKTKSSIKLNAFKSSTC